MYRPKIISTTFFMKIRTTDKVFVMVSVNIALMPKLTETIIHDKLAKPAALLRPGNPADEVHIVLHHVSRGHRPSLKA
jgi:hypothetical protein